MVRPGPHSSGVAPADFQETHIAALVLDVWVYSAPRFATGADLSPSWSDSGANGQGSAESCQEFTALVTLRSCGKFPPSAPRLRSASPAAAGCVCFIVDGCHSRPRHILEVWPGRFHRSLACSLTVAAACSQCC